MMQRHTRMLAAIGRLPARGVALILTGYRLTISPLLGPRCRFHPGCSSYAQQAVLRFGVIRGGWLTLRRLARCGPWHRGGLDPVPDQWPGVAGPERRRPAPNEASSV